VTACTTSQTVIQGGASGALVAFAGPKFPEITTNPATDIGYLGAKLNANITVASPLCDERGFDYGPVLDGYPFVYTNEVTETGSFGTGAFSLPIYGLTASQKYRFRAKAHNEAGWAYGSDLEFTTLTTPPEPEPEMELSVKITRNNPGTFYFLRAHRWTWQMKKLLNVTPLPGDLQTGNPRRLALDFGGLQEVVTVFGRLKESDRDEDYEPRKVDISNAVRTWWVDAAGAAWQDKFVELQIAEDVKFEGVLAYIRFDRDSGQDDWFDYTMRFLARERLDSNIVV
jgi:hypothetical protein